MTNPAEELKYIGIKLLDCLRYLPTKKGSHFNVSAVNNDGIYSVGLFSNDFFNLDLVELKTNVETYWKIADELVYAIVFRGSVDLRFRKADLTYKRTLREKSVEIAKGTPFLFQTNVEKCSILLIGFSSQGGKNA